MALDQALRDRLGLTWRDIVSAFVVGPYIYLNYVSPVSLSSTLPLLGLQSRLEHQHP
jgi:hypothetical protein